MNQIKKIVLTGGPCAGKTTAMVKVIEHFSSLGYKVFTIPGFQPCSPRRA